MSITVVLIDDFLGQRKEVDSQIDQLKMYFLIAIEIFRCDFSHFMLHLM